MSRVRKPVRAASARRSRVRSARALERARAELAQERQRIRAFLETTPDQVYFKDRESRFLRISASQAKHLGFARAEDAIGKTDFDVFSYEHARRAFEDEREIIRTGKPIVGVEECETFPDGSERWVSTNKMPLRDDRGAIIGTFGISRDITERVVLEREREHLELERRVSQRLEAVGQLASGIAHEINTPMQYVGDSVTFLHSAIDDLMTLMGTYRELLCSDEPISRDARLRRMAIAEQNADLEYLQQRIPTAFVRTVDGIGRVTSIVKAMKRFSHASSAEPVPADLGDAIQTTLAVCRNEYKYVADVDLALGDVPLVTCIIGEINQVLLNVIINAAHAIEERVGGSDERGTIRIATYVDGPDAVIEVGDDGVGIPPELQDRIYEPFFTTKEIGRGSGQGLALVRTTIEQHAGSIVCESEPGHGTTFTLRLPLGPPSATRGAARPAR